jgi:hypothetical protein
MSLKWLNEHSFIEGLITGNGKARKLREVQREAEDARQRQYEALEQAGLQAARLTELSAEMVVEDDDSIDVQGRLTPPEGHTGPSTSC